MARLWYPDRGDVETLAYELAAELFADYDSALPGLALLGGEREEGRLLDSALALPRQTFGGRPLYRSIHDKAGVLLRSMIKNHPLVDGNKRVGMATTALFLLMNGHLLLPPSAEMVRFAVELAESEPAIRWETVATWVRENTIPFRGERRVLQRDIRARFKGQTDVAERITDNWVILSAVMRRLSR